SNDNIKAMILKGSCIDPDTGSRVLCDSEPNKKLIPTTTWKYQAFTPQFGTNCPPFCRFPRPGLAFEHTLFLNTFQLWDLATKYGVNKGLPARGFAFADTPPTGGQTANDIFIKWYGDQDARWQYNPTDHLYYRWNTGLPHVDANTGKQLTADNVLIMEAPHKVRPDIYESESGSPTIEVQIWGQGPAWLFRDGQWYQGLWIHRSREHGALMFTTQNGLASIPLKPGNSWVEVVRQLSANVKTSDTLADVQSTATYAAMTATAKFPALPSDRLTQTAVVAQKTLSVSEATAGYSNSTGSTAQGTSAADSSANATSTPSPQGMGMVVP
ncbi:MAG TPA: DUF3048 C-terminal domain-containing protein, partial [Aggregatilineales bacterium]|nr:DUF3048 C-terminal domain-containing protein [Aggregatilineales bacterium]